MSKKISKPVVIASSVIIVIIMIFTIFDFNSLDKSRIYGQRNDEIVKQLAEKIRNLEKNISGIKSKQSAIFVLIFISLLLNFILVGSTLYSFFKNKNQKKKKN